MIGTIAGPLTSSEPSAGRGFCACRRLASSACATQSSAFAYGVRRLRRSIGDPSFDPVQQIHIRHRIGIVRVELNGDLQHAEAILDLRPVLCADLLPQCRRPE